MTFAPPGFYSEEVQRTDNSATTSGAKASTPTITKSGRRGVAGTVTLACATPSSTIEYEIDGGGFSTYSAPFALAAGELVEAYATRASYVDSEIAEFLNLATAGNAPQVLRSLLPRRVWQTVLVCLANGLRRYIWSRRANGLQGV